MGPWPIRRSCGAEGRSSARDAPASGGYAPRWLTDFFHVDHWAAAIRILRLALDRLPGFWLRNMVIRGYEIWSTLPANRIADITAVIKIKEQAIAAFSSQMKSTDFVSAALGLNRYRSMVYSQAADMPRGFLETTVAQYRELFEAIILRGNGARHNRATPIVRICSKPPNRRSIG